ncbi:hypothetical protein [Magnetospirillum sp. 15-1]|uniref:hypothetical protein n=1 Tax=Magnetospirillum sp. 15-1 TaxID=1979370 RepID=UPI000BBC4907|nr:hypothetical protein [Magnetospirillum sp. 15-1]
MSALDKVRTYGLLAADLWRWRRLTAGMRAARPALAQSRRLIICDLVNSLMSAKAQGLIARAAQDRGMATTVLMARPWRLAEATYRAAGPVEFVYLDDFLTTDIRRRAEDEAARLVEADPHLTGLITLEQDGIRVGRNVMSIVLRHLRQGRIDPSNREHRDLVRRQLAQSLATKEASAALLRAHPAQAALFNERGYTPAGEFFDSCLMAGVDAIQWLGAPQAERLLFKRYGLENRPMHPLALSDASWERIKARPWTAELDQRLMAQMTGHYNSGTWYNRQQLQDGKQIKPAHEVRRQLGLDPDKKTAVIFCHILYDATFFFGDSLYPDYESWLVETVRGAMANPHLNWVVKVHPVNVWRSKMDGQPMEQLEAQALQRAFGTLPDHIRIMAADTDINTLSLFNAMDYGLTVRGTVGMELPCFGVPVVTAGTGRYAGRGFTMDPADPDEYQRLLARLHEVPALAPEVVELARRYAYGTFFLRPIPFTSFALDFNADGRGVVALNQNVRLQAGLTEIPPDLAALADWMANGREADYLDPHAAAKEWDQ